MSLVRDNDARTSLDRAQGGGAVVRRSAVSRVVQRAALRVLERTLELDHRRLELVRAVEALNLAISLRQAYKLVGDLPPTVDAVLEHFEDTIIDESLAKARRDTLRGLLPRLLS